MGGTSDNGYLKPKSLKPSKGHQATPMSFILILGLFLFFLEAAYKVAILVLACVAVKAFKKWNYKGPKKALWTRLNEAVKVISTPYGS
jgi:hypothetical protein